MNKSELREKIKSLVRNKFDLTSPEISNIDEPIDLDTLGGVDLDITLEKFPVLGKFPTLKQIIIDLMTDQYDLFINDILWVAPRPTTFRLNLINGQAFFLTYTERSWVAQIEGKKYYLLNLKEEESAIDSLARILKYGTPDVSQPTNTSSSEAPPPEEKAPVDTPSPEGEEEKTPTEA